MVKGITGEVGRGCCTPTSQPPQGCFQPGPTPAQLHLPRPVWRQQGPPRGVPQYGDQAEIPSSFTRSRRIFCHFPLVRQSYVCVNLAGRGTTGLELLEAPHKHLHHWMALGNISRPVGDGSQGNSGLPAVVNSGDRDLHLSHVCQPNHPTNYSSSVQHGDSLHLPLWPERPLCCN